MSSVDSLFVCFFVFFFFFFLSADLKTLVKIFTAKRTTVVHRVLQISTKRVGSIQNSAGNGLILLLQERKKVLVIVGGTEADIIDGVSGGQKEVLTMGIKLPIEQSPEAMIREKSPCS